MNYAKKKGNPGKLRAKKKRGKRKKKGRFGVDKPYWVSTASGAGIS